MTPQEIRKSIKELERDFYKINRKIEILGKELPDYKLSPEVSITDDGKIQLKIKAELL